MDGRRICRALQPVQIGTDFVRLYARTAMEVGLPRVHKLSIVEGRRRVLERPREVTTTKPHETGEQQEPNYSGLAPLSRRALISYAG